jgi:hypothetical protein
MFEALFGNKSIEKILIFLFVNGKCFGTQLQRSLKTSLTPIQKALQRLEKGGLILSYLEGKTRVYHFNPNFPLNQELEQLIKKAYTLLSPQEKKIYSIIHIQKPSSLASKENKEILLTIWKRLGQVKHLNFSAKTKSTEETGWNGRGKGEVSVTSENNSTLIFNEKGSWLKKEGSLIDFSNTFRWTLDQEAGTISLEHLRHGWNHPVFLFDLIPTGRHFLSSLDSHFCGEDIYFGQIFFDKNGLKLNWRVIGPKKNEEIDYYYV